MRYRNNALTGSNSYAFKSVRIATN